jgi:hypothetical protein
MKKLLNEWRQFLTEEELDDVEREFDEEEMVKILDQNGRDFYGILDDLTNLGYQADHDVRLLQKYMFGLSVDKYGNKDYKPPKMKQFMADHPDGVYVLMYHPSHKHIPIVNLLVNGDQVTGDQKRIGPNARLSAIGPVKGKEI